MSSYYRKDRIIHCKDTGEKVAMSSYLTSKHWKNFRNNVFEFYKGECQRCHTVIPLSQAQIHHRNHNNLGYENVRDCVLYCSKCHTVVHKNRSEHKDINSFMMSMLKDLTFEEKIDVCNYVRSIKGLEPVIPEEMLKQEEERKKELELKRILKKQKKGIRLSDSEQMKLFEEAVSKPTPRRYPRKHVKN